MESIGEHLRKEREQRNLTIEDVAKSTKIKDCYLRAIEEERFESLPSPFYVKSFLGLYAKSLGLNPNDILTRFHGEQQDLTVKPPEVPTFLVPRKKRIRPATFLFSIFGIVSAVVMVYFPPAHSPEEPPSLTASQPAVSSSAFQIAVAQDRSESIPLPREEKGEALQKEEAIVEGEIPVKEVISVKENVPALEIKEPGPPACSVIEAGFGRGVEVVQDCPKLIGISSQFPCKRQRVYFFTRIQSPAKGKISHVWRWEGKVIQTISMEVRAPAWSIYSYVTVRPQQTGEWRVEVRDGSAILSSQSFKVIDSDLLT